MIQDPEQKLLKGKPVAEGIKDQVASRITAIVSRGKRAPCLATVIANSDPGARSYVRSKALACKRFTENAKPNVP